MDTAVKPDMHSCVAQCCASAEEAKSRFLKTFEFVPADKLNWSPNEHGRSALQLAAHCALANYAFAEAIRGDALKFPDGVTDFHAFMRSEENKHTDREAVVKMLEDSTRVAVQALQSMTPDRFGSIPDSPFGPMPMAFWMSLPGMHMQAHASQVDYLQTCWRDFENHF
jgi:hypothetical protein